MEATLAEKILMKNTGEINLTPGQIVTAYPDRYMIHDIYTSSIKRVLKEMHVKRLADPSKGVIFIDHLLPTNYASTDPIHFRDALEIAEKYHVTDVHKGEGICHHLMHELRIARPGEIVVATDSHTTTYGGAACFSTGIGHTEMAAVMATGQMWFKVPKALKFVLDGEFQPGVVAKNLILKILGDLRSDGAQYMSMEFTGPGVSALSMESRFTICNMALEVGAKVGLFEADQKTADYYQMSLTELDWLTVGPDDRYEQVFHYDLNELEPQLSCPQGVDNVHPVSEVAGTKVDEVFIGSCTNGSIEDLAEAANVLAGHHVAPYTKLVVTPATISVYKQAVKRGYIQTFVKAGGSVTHPDCGLCAGQPYGLLADDEVVVGTNNRNFVGRMGTNKSLIYLASPATAARAAIAGEFVATTASVS